MVCAGHHVCGLPELPGCPGLSCQSLLHCSCPWSSREPSQQSGCRQGPESGSILNHGEKPRQFLLLNHPVQPLSPLAWISHFPSLSHRRMFEVCRAPISALCVLSGRGHAEQHVTPDPVKHWCTFCRSGLLGLWLQSDLQQPRLQPDRDTALPLPLLLQGRALLWLSRLSSSVLSSLRYCGIV